MATDSIRGPAAANRIELLLLQQDSEAIVANPLVVKHLEQKTSRATRNLLIESPLLGILPTAEVNDDPRL